MQLPMQLTLRDIPSSPALESHIRKKAEKLDHYYDRIISCRIVIELSQNHKHHGKLYNVRIDLMVPGKELVVTRKENVDIYVALRDAFAALNRRLEEHSNKRHGNVKHHEEMMQGRVSRLVLKEGYGFIEGADGNEYYFSLTNVSFPKFEQLIIGDLVEYVPIALSTGLQAQHVTKFKSNGHSSE